MRMVLLLFKAIRANGELFRHYCLHRPPPELPNNPGHERKTIHFMPCLQFWNGFLRLEHGPVPAAAALLYETLPRSDSGYKAKTFSRRLGAASIDPKLKNRAYSEAIVPYRMCPPRAETTNGRSPG